MTTPFAQYPYDILQSVGTNLGTISDQVKSSSKGAADVEGLQADQADIISAISDFRDEWKYSVDKLGENIGDLGQLSGQIGQMAGGLDTALADAMRPAASTGGSSTSGRGR